MIRHLILRNLFDIPNQVGYKLDVHPLRMATNKTFLLPPISDKGAIKLCTVIAENARKQCKKGNQI